MNTSDRLEELDWLAFQYVADELDGVERAAFELRLEEDTAACEAVVSAMKLAQAVDHSFGTELRKDGTTPEAVDREIRPASQSPATANHSSFSRTAALSIAATVAAAIFGWWLINQPAANSIDNHGTVAIAWADSGEDTNWDSSADTIVADDLQSVGYESIQDAEDDLLRDSDDEWLLVALVDIEDTNSESME